MLLLYYLITLYEAILILRILLSWIRPDPSNIVVVWIYKITDPVLDPIRKAIPLHGMGIDFSPMVVFFIIEIIKRYL